MFQVSGLGVPGFRFREWEGLGLRSSGVGASPWLRCFGFRVRVPGSGSRFRVFSSRILGSGFRVPGSGVGFRVEGSGFRVQGLE